MATDFASYLFESMTPEQQAAFIAKNQAEGVVQAPTANNLAGLRPDQVAAIKKTIQEELAPARDSPAWTNSGQGYERDHAALNNELASLNDSSNYIGGNYQPGGLGGPGWDPQTAILDRERQAINNQNIDATAKIAQLGNSASDTNARNDAAIAQMNQLINEQDPRNAAYLNGLNAQTDALSGYRDTANSQASSALNTYLTGLQGVNGDIDTSLGNLDSVYGQIQQPLQSTVQWGGDLTSQGAQADPQALAAQTAALGMLGATAGGALDYTSQAAGAYADPKYLAMRDQGLQDLRGASQGSMDVLPGQLDPKAYGAAMSALSQMGQLTNPALTDQERFLYEQARQAQEMDERGADAAMMSKLRRQGLASGGAALTQGALTDQRLSQNRLLSDLAASGAAVARSQDMLKSYGQLGSQLNSEANQLGTANSNRKLQALGLYEQGSETAEQASFDQEYKRGLAADQASRDNQQTRLQGQVAYGNEANAMQDDAFNRGQAADQMAQYNRTTSLDVDMYNNNFAQRERDALANRTATQTGLHLSGDAQKSNNLTNANNATQSVVDNNYLRDAQVVGQRKSDLNTGKQVDDQQLGRRLATQGAAIGVNQGNFGNNVTIGGLGLDQLKFNTGALLQNDTQVLGSVAAKQSVADAQDARDAQLEADANKGILGTSIGSQNDPLWAGNWFRGKTGPDIPARRT